MFLTGMIILFKLMIVSRLIPKFTTTRSKIKMINLSHKLKELEFRATFSWEAYSPNCSIIFISLERNKNKLLIDLQNIIKIEVSHNLVNGYNISYHKKKI